jgi:UDP-N-acetylmuramate--alanine ligase
MPTTLLLGAGGTGVRNLGRLLLDSGSEVVAADAASQALHNFPALRGAKIVSEKDARDYLREVQRIVYSDALSPDHPLLTFARAERKIAVPYHEMVAELAAGKTMIAVAGTHGKSSTCAMLAHVLLTAGQDPTVLLGADVPAWGGVGARRGAGELFIAEADEYRDHFLAFSPEQIIVTSIDFDHPDYFSSLAAVQHSFSAFLERLREGGNVIALQAVKEAHPDVRWPATTRTVVREQLRLRLPGEHMLDNATLAKAMAVQLGVPAASAERSLENFQGIARRAELLGTLDGMTVISDYGHHPAAIAATYAALRARYPRQRIAVLFEPHTLRRLAALQDDFAASLSQTDEAVLLPVFVPAGREEEAKEAVALLRSLADTVASQGTPVRILSSAQELKDTLTQLAEKYDAAVAFTAGALDQHLREIVKQD